MMPLDPPRRALPGARRPEATEPFVTSSASTIPSSRSSQERSMAQQAKPAPSPGFRIETDSLGPVEVPEDAYWGVHTKRALDNFPIAKRPISVYPDFIVALASVKQAAARANLEVGVIT